MVSTGYYDQLKREDVPVEAVLQLEPLRYAIACNPSVPDTIIAAMQGELNKMIASGEQAAIIDKYKSIENKTAAATDKAVAAK